VSIPKSFRKIARTYRAAKLEMQGLKPYLERSKQHSFLAVVPMKKAIQVYEFGSEF